MTPPGYHHRVAKRHLEYMRVRDLIPAPRNPKGHDEDLLEASLARFGYTEPIMLDERTGKMVVGHGRRNKLLGQEAAGEDPPDGIEVDNDGAFLAPIVRGWASKDDAEAEAYVITSNRLVETGGWVDEVLRDMLGDLNQTDRGLLGVGFTTHELDDLAAKLDGPTSLDDLARELGDPDPTAMWPLVRVKISPENKARYQNLIAGIDGDDDTVFAHVLDLAEQGLKAADSDSD